MQIKTRVLLLALALALVGCAGYVGGARKVDPARLVTEPGWIVAGYTPTLRQGQERDCGAASLAMIAGRWGVSLSVANARAQLPEAPGGARLGDMRDLARGRGLRAYAIAGDRDTLLHELARKRPVVVGLWQPYRKVLRSHYAVVVAARPDLDEFVVIDPARGWRTYTWAALDAEWKPGGRPTLVVLGPAPTQPEVAGGELRGGQAL